MPKFQRRPFIILILLALSLMPVFAQPYVRIADKEPAVEQLPAGYYLIKLKFVSVKQIAASFKAGGAYARYIPPTVESIVGLPKLQSIAIKTSVPQDVLTMTRLITQLDCPARSYEIACTVVLMPATAPPALPSNFALLPPAELNAKLRSLVAQQQASVISYPNLHIDLTGFGDIAAQENSSYYRITREGIVILPQDQLFPAMPAFHLSHIPSAANALTTGQFGFARMPEDNTVECAEYTLGKSMIAGAVVFSYTGLVAAEGTTYRLYLLVTLGAG